jgi:small GTP-binding protein
VLGGLLTAIEDQYQKITEVDGIKVSVELLDTAGTEQFMALHSMYMKSGDGFILVFSLTSMDSLQELSSLRDQILRLKEVDGYHAVSRPVLVCLLYTTKLTSVSVG